MSAPPLVALLSVQDIDTARDQVRHRRLHHPARAELAALAAADAAAVARRARAEATRDEAAERQARLEAELATTEARSADHSRRLYGGEVSASRELQAMAADIESLDRRASDLQDAVLEVLDEREPLDAAVATLDAERAERAARRAVAVEELARGEAELDAEMAELDGRRAAAAEGVTPELLAMYDRIRRQLGGIGAAPLVGNHCGGCHLVLPATELDRLKYQSDDAVVTCDNCGRILVRR
jgi:predicted  nucleic acid-binding Zn-ribbon protein